MATSSRAAESGVRAHVVAVLGPNPASLTELLWSLVRVRGMQVASVRIAVESARTLVYVERELLGGVGAYEDLRSCLADRLPPAPTLVAPDQLPAHETSDEVVHAMPEVFWTAATEALAEAGPEECVVFGLTGGRRRASHAAVTSVFQFLARPQDLLFDVRVSHRQAEGGSGFFFPEQRRQQLVGELRGERVPFLAKDVAVRLDQVEVPRLRAFLTVTPPPTFAEAL